MVFPMEFIPYFPCFEAEGQQLETLAHGARQHVAQGHRRLQRGHFSAFQELDQWVLSSIYHPYTAPINSIHNIYIYIMLVKQ